MTETPEPASISMLHSPNRAENLQDLGDHLTTTARLSRLIWGYFYGFVCAPEGVELDPRDIAALYELACFLSDHASAALHIYENRRGDHD